MLHNLATLINLISGTSDEEILWKNLNKTTYFMVNESKVHIKKRILRH